MFTIIRTLTLPPGCCKLCGGSSKEWYLDMGHSEEFHGAIYYCNECIGAVADVCGYMEPGKAKLLEDEVKLLDGLLADLRQENMDLQEGLDALLRARFIAPAVPDPVPDDSGSLGNDDLPSLEIVGDGETGPSEGEAPVGSGEGADAEQVHVEEWETFVQAQSAMEISRSTSSPGTNPLNQAGTPLSEADEVALYWEQHRHDLEKGLTDGYSDAAVADPTLR